MGLNISEIIQRKEISLKDLKDKIVAIDAFNTIYQFLTTIRQADGTPLMDKNKKISSKKIQSNKEKKGIRRKSLQ